MKPTGWHFLILVICCFATKSMAAPFTRQDSLRGGNGHGRDWWKVLKYDLQLEIDTLDQHIRGTNTILFSIPGKARDSMQIDLQEGMNLLPVKGPQGESIRLPREGNVYWLIRDATSWETGKVYSLQLRFEGKPRTAVNPPWDGGFIWTRDSSEKPWISVACQGLGASAWWPCKDYQGDEPDAGMTIKVALPTKERIISNGRCISTITRPDGIKEGQYELKNPINTYGVSFYVGDYSHWHDTLHGEKGVLDLDFYPLRMNEKKARKQWAITKEMLRCYEYWLGPYPFYEDGYKLVEAPYMGMEHQSAIAYGNQYQMGYNGRGQHKDRSGTGIGFDFDFIIIHESAHEWFGNSITAKDVADNWIHEGFTTYMEALFAEWIRSKDSGVAYTMGEWNNIRNERPVIGSYGVNDEGDVDKYDKGAAVIHMIRMMILDDDRFRQLLHGLNREFYHKTVTSHQVEDYISRFVGIDLRVFFNVYLRSTIKPKFEWSFDGTSFHYNWNGVPNGFTAPFILPESGAKWFSPANGGKKYWAPDRIISCGWYDVLRR